MRTYLLLSFTCLLTFVVGCGDNTNITNVNDAMSTVIGRVTPPEPKIQVALWQAAEYMVTQTDDSGYFAFSEVIPGIYEVHITVPNGALTVQSDVIARAGETTTLVDILISSLPWPIVSTVPSNGEKDVSPASLDIRLSSLVPIKLSSLNDFVDITPAVTGSWYEAGNSYAHYYYDFRPDVQLATDTVYQITLSAELEFVSGQTFDHVYTFSFSTVPMGLENTQWEIPNLDYGLESNFTGNLVQLTYVSALDFASVASAVNVQPDLDFYVKKVNASSFDIVIEGGLTCGTTYSITVGDAIADILGVHPTRTDTMTFNTEVFEVISRQYPSGRTKVHPRTKNPLLEFRFSAPLDTSSAPTSVTISPDIEMDIFINTVYYPNGGLLRLDVPDGLSPSQVYTVTIGDNLMSTDGTPLGSKEVVEFQTQSLLVTAYGFSSGYSGLDTVTDPGDFFGPRIYLNADVNVDSVNVAVAIDPQVDGFWTAMDDGYSDPYLYFFQTTTDIMPPEQIYTITIDGSIGLANGIGFGDNVVLTLQTDPLLITNITPVPGSQSVGTHINVEIQFNSPMDRPLTEAAFTMTTYDGTPVAGTFNWSYFYGNQRMSFRPVSLLAGVTYLVDVDTSAKDLTGHNLKYSGSTYFRVAN